jgi:hypothetical protein
MKVYLGNSLLVIKEFHLFKIYLPNNIKPFGNNII